mmetsp:Transcript_69917/g.166905  ORF Transcript_69917/g.166905 Transcript_69917/m.166905 type:complete len:243 (+) Transcript_69917:86-814(+)|eukprot:CAMPEP_0181470070 /NCGR_PEP_ID=MMETSP1110-20121109/38359_1 /TAXON_ID=174948 /ORGANISM="Symbiodinium sp., Strain CCMP421" /LENGTH=242 /DNA_ID=CAMNT_0023595025 /DNA_START=65 /DNA_END=793 /DNA_ORIENTATION=-
MKTLLLAVCAYHAHAAVLLRTAGLHPWYASPETTAPKDKEAKPSDCHHPQCAWDCGAPECSKSCKAVCQPPRCVTACSKPTEQECRHVCQDPKCAVVCPPHTCDSDDCPPPICQTVCGEPVCRIECGNSQGCETTCDDPVCAFDCKVDEKSCVKPECKLNCERPANCQGNKTVSELPFAYRMETDTAPEKPSAGPKASGKTEVAWKGLAKVGDAVGPLDQRKMQEAAPSPAPAPAPAGFGPK